MNCDGKRRNWLLASALAGWLIVASTPAISDGTVSFCFNEWPPFTMTEEGKAVGISVDILTEASRSEHLKPHFSALPWKRCLEEVRKGNIDAVIDAASRSEFVQGPTSFSEYTNTFWVRKENLLKIFNLEDLRNKIVGLVHGYDYPVSLMDEMRLYDIVIEHSVDDATNIRKLAFGRVDSIVSDLASTLQYARKHGLRLRPLEPTHSLDSLYVSFNSEAKGLQGRIDRAVARLIADGAVDRIYRFHLGIGFCDMSTHQHFPVCR
jgi:ABC-type amino acid transport substrate-binding protein